MPSPVDPVPSGDGSPARLAFTQAFGFAVDQAGVTSHLTQTVDTARQVLDALRAKIHDALLNRVVEAQVDADIMSGKVKTALAGRLVEAAQAVTQLQQPIYSALVNQLGSTLEATQGLGVVMPQPGEEAPCPDCVAIRSAASAGDLGPALACFRARALPLKDLRGMEFARIVDWIEKCLPADQSIHVMFAQAIQGISNAPVAGPAVGFTPSPSTPIRTPPPPFDVTIRAQQAGISPADCAKQVAAWAQAVERGRAACDVQFGGDPAALGQCYADVVARASTQYPCGGPDFGPVGPMPGGRSGLGGPGFVGRVGPKPVKPGQPVALPGGGNVGVFQGPPGTPQAPPASLDAGCDPAAIQDFFGGCLASGNTIDNCCYQYTQATGLRCYPTSQEAACDTGFAKFDVVDNETGQIYQICVKCNPSPVPSPSTPSGPCPPVNVVVNCPPPATPSAPQPTPEQPTPPQAEYPDDAPAVSAGGDFGGCQEFGPTPLADVPAGLVTIAEWLGLMKRDGTIRLPFPDAGALDVGKNIVNGIIGAINRPVVDTFRAVQAFLSQTGCGSGEQLGLIATAAIVELGAKFVGSSLDVLRIPNQQKRNFLCPTGLPDAAQAASAWLANNIDPATLECWVRAAGMRFPEFFQYIDASRTKLSPGEYAFLLRRGEIDAAQFRDKTRECGMTRDDDAAHIYKLTEQIPPPSDLTQLMVRDAADTVNIDWSKEDALFPQKFAGIVKTWADQAGVQTEYMKLLWRAHFSIPAPGQLSVMLHRLSRLPAGDPARVDLATIENALVQQDISPKWVKQFVAISYNPLTRIDSRRAFEVGALDEDGLLEAYLNIGYNRADALTLVEFNKKTIRQKFMRRPEVTQLAHGEMSDAEYDEAMRDWGADDKALQAGRDRAKILRSVSARKTCIKAFHKRFMQGDFDDQKAIQLIVNQGVQLETATVIVEGWKCERDARGKLFSAQQLASLYADGLIDETDYVRRAVRLGWDQEDAVIMLRQVQRRQGIKAATAQQKELAAEQRAQDKLARQLRSAARSADVAARRQATDISKARSVRDLRIKRVLAAAVKFAEHSGMEIPDAIVAVRSIYNAALNDFPVTPAEAIQALTLLVADKNVNTLHQLTADLATALTTQAS